MKKVYLVLWVIFFIVPSGLAMAERQQRALIKDDYPNEWEEAVQISLNKDINGELEIDNDVDWFKFEVTVSDGFFITFYGISQKGWAWLTLREYPDRTSAISQINYFYDETSEVSLNLSPGVYYISVFGDYLAKYRFHLKSSENTGNVQSDPINCFTQSELDEQYKNGIDFCKRNPHSCGLFSKYDLENEYDKGFDDGIASVDIPECKQILTQNDLDEKYDEGFKDGVASVDIPDCEECTQTEQEQFGVRLTPELNMHIPLIQYSTLLGDLKLWGDFKFVSGENGEMLWKLVDFGEIKKL